MKSIDPNEINVIDVQAILTGAIAPRPIAFASTVDANGKPNLAPFSFFNAFGANPPMLIFSPALRGRDGSSKHTLENVKLNKEVVINMVNYSMVEQMNVASADYDQTVNEFGKSGFTELASDTIKPPRVKESPVQFECKVTQVIETGTEGGAGNLVICHIEKIHIDESILDDIGKIDPLKIDLVGRMGGEFYIRTLPESIFTVSKPINKIGIGIDQLPLKIRNSDFLSGNDLGQLAGVDRLPNPNELVHYTGLEQNIIAEGKDLLKAKKNWEALCLLMGSL